MNRTILPHENLRRPFVELDDRPDRDACPDAGRIWDALEDRLPRDERLAVVEHVAACGSCAQAWRLAHALGAMEEAGAPAEAGAGSATNGGRGRLWAGLAAAAAVLVVALVVWRSGAPANRAPEFRAPAGTTIESLVDDGAALPRDAFELRWSGPAGAHYRVRVATEDLRLLHEAADVGTTSYRIPAEALADVPSGARVVAQVRGWTEDGAELAPRTFTVRVE